MSMVPGWCQETRAASRVIPAVKTRQARCCRHWTAQNSSSPTYGHLVQVWDLDSFACVQTLDHEGTPVQLIDIAGTRLHSVAGRTVLFHCFRSPLK